jgi:hypothetical protein
MPVVNGAYDGRRETVENGTVLDQTGRAMLITDVECPDTVQLSSIDSEPARVRMHGEVIDGDRHYTDMAFDSLNQARLAYGLWDEYGPFSDPEGDAIPVDVAVGGQEAIAAYLRTNGGYPQSRAYVAERMGVHKNTISNYCNRVRWEPDFAQMEERVIQEVHSMNGEFTQGDIKANVDASDDTIQSVLGKMNNLDIAEPVDEDSERWRVIN